MIFHFGTYLSQILKDFWSKLSHFPGEMGSLGLGEKGSRAQALSGLEPARAQARLLQPLQGTRNECIACFGVCWGFGGDRRRRDDRSFFTVTFPHARGRGRAGEKSVVHPSSASASFCSAYSICNITVFFSLVLVKEGG